jgi:hypothetical protein
MSEKCYCVMCPIQEKCFGEDTKAYQVQDIDKCPLVKAIEIANSIKYID